MKCLGENHNVVKHQVYHNGVIVMTLNLVHDLKMKSFIFAAKIGMSLLHMASGTLINVTVCPLCGNEIGTPILCYFAYSTVIQTHNKN